MFFSFKKKIKTFIVFCIICIIGAVAFRYYAVPKYLFPLKYESIIDKYSKEYNIEKSLICAMINVESSFDKDALSYRGAKGLMQIMDTTGEWGAKELGIENFTPDMLFDPEINIKIGCWYINKLNDQFEGQQDTVLSAYNAGSGHVSGWLDDESYSHDGMTLHSIPFEETNNYVKKVNANIIIYEKLYGFE